MWSIDGWEKRKSKFLQVPPGRGTPLVGETKVQFHNDQTHLLVSHESQLAIYDGKLECVRSVSSPLLGFCHCVSCFRKFDLPLTSSFSIQWYPRETLAAPISSAIYSCDGQLAYVGFCDGAVGVFDVDNLRLRCRIAPSAYISPVARYVNSHMNHTIFIFIENQ